MIIKMVVAGQGFDGPDLYFCKLDMSEKDIHNGNHYDFAKLHAKKHGFDGEMVAFDENDNPKPLFDLIKWETASVYKH